MSASQHLRLRALILTGGQSSRMGFPKYLLPMPVAIADTSSRPLLLHLLDILEHIRTRFIDQFTERATISVRDQAQCMEIKHLLDDSHPFSNVTFEFVTDAVTVSGPTQGLLAAYNFDANAHWLVVGCDYPLLGLNAVEQLIVTHQAANSAITCFRNSQGFAEPLLSIWSPSSLSVLAQLAEEVSPSVGPNQAIKSIQRAHGTRISAEHENCRSGVGFVQPLDENGITSVDTKDQWEAVQNLLKAFP